MVVVALTATVATAAVVMNSFIVGRVVTRRVGWLVEERGLVVWWVGLGERVEGGKTTFVGGKRFEKVGKGKGKVQFLYILSSAVCLLCLLVQLESSW